MADDTPLLDIYDSFKSTTYGTKLAGMVRYEKYKPVSLDNEEWVKVLGPDVNNLEHMLVTYKLTGVFLKNSDEGGFSDEDSDVLLVAALIHDWAEAIVGDVSFGDRSTDTDAKEVYVFQKHLNKFYTGKDRRHLQLIQKAASEVIFDHESKLGKAFNAVERLGYLSTAIRAYHQRTEDLDEDLKDGLMWLVADVLANQISSLTKYSDDYAAVAVFLVKNKATINMQFDLINKNSGIFQKYGQKEQEKRDQFSDAQKAWGIWKVSKPV